MNVLSVEHTQDDWGEALLSDDHAAWANGDSRTLHEVLGRAAPNSNSNPKPKPNRNPNRNRNPNPNPKPTPTPTPTLARPCTRTTSSTST